MVTLCMSCVGFCKKKKRIVHKSFIRLYIKHLRIKEMFRHNLQLFFFSIISTQGYLVSLLLKSCLHLVLKCIFNRCEYKLAETHYRFNLALTCSNEFCFCFLLTPFPFISSHSIIINSQCDQ